MNLFKEQAAIAPEIEQVDAAIRRRLERLCKDDAVLDEVFRAFFKGCGKLLRPRLVLLSAFALRGGDLRSPPDKPLHDALISLGTVFEMVHSASLMHDDVLDDSATRRALPSLNALFGNKIAILAGDILYSEAFELLAEAFESRISLMLTRCVHQMCRAEISNLVKHDFETYCDIIAAKTASLMRVCCRAGTEVVRRSDDDPELIHALESFGHCFGMVFQLADDLNDGDSEVAAAHPDKVVALLKKYTHDAEMALAVLPNSVFREQLSLMLQSVVASVKNPMSAGAVPLASGMVDAGV